MDDQSREAVSSDASTATQEDPDGISSNETQQKPLTHRSRAQARLSPKVIKAPSPKGSNPISGNAPDLRPFADQLMAIAEQLRSGDWRNETAKSGSAAEYENSANVAVLNPPSDQKPRLAAGQLTQHTHSEAQANESLEHQRKQYAAMARATYAKRRKRVSIFEDPELFGEPAWDILLDLYIAQIEGKPVSVSSACIGSASPPTTGLRWLGVLADQKLVLREHDPLDQRRVLVRLTEKALKLMDEYFASSAAQFGDQRVAQE
ncbi:MAG: MarR family winged helix-turn-helix transcriptional regulator [Pseudomonadota bacterium]|nr:MarR family winged helix-turn-helix transcriptional regulator [Pseudomonadota bacterium]